MQILPLIGMQSAGGQEVASDDGSRPPWAVVEQKIQSHALVGFEWVDQARGGILLIELPDRFCAVKFLSWHTGDKTSKGGMFHSDGVSQYAEIELVDLPPHPSRAMLSQAVARHVSLSWHPLLGIGRLTFQRGRTDVTCGHTQLPWLYPTAIFGSQTKHGDIVGLRLAPTAWTRFSDIDLTDPMVRWYGYDESRDHVMEIPVEDLPGAEPGANRGGASLTPRAKRGLINK
jgi:hypothetical protein